MKEPLAGIWPIIRFILRRDRLRIPLWTIAIVAFVVSVVDSWTELFPTETDRQERAALMENPVMVIFNGPGFGFDDYTIGAMAANELLILAAVAVAIMSILLVARHTRAEEESGRTELVRASVVGRHAATAAALTVVWVLNIVIGLLIGAALPTAVEGLEWQSSVLFGLSISSVGITFAAIAAVTAQLSAHSRTATGMASAILAFSFILRAVGDVGDRTMSWLSPIGWAQSTRAFVDDHWWPLALSFAFTVGVTLLAAALAARRDFGASLVPQRPGSPTASAVLANPMGLSFRLQRGSLLGWGIGLVLGAISFGAVSAEIVAFADDNPGLEEILTAVEGVTMLESFLGLMVLLLALLASAYSAQSALRFRHEETEGRAEPLLATPLPRIRWAGSHIAVSLLGGAGLLLLSTLALGLTAAVMQDEWSLVGELLGAGLAYVPALWLVIGIMTALFGLFPAAMTFGWVVVVYAVFVGLLGEVLQLPEGMFNLSPFHHVPPLPGGEFSIAPLAVLTLTAAALTAVGLAGFRRRDLLTT